MREGVEPGPVFDGFGADDDSVCAGVEQTLVAADGAAFDYFGYSVALSADGTRALIGVPNDDVGSNANAGSARLFVFNGLAWTEEWTFVSSGAIAGDQFGWSVALAGDGSRALVGARSDDTTSPTITDRGSARVFLRTGSSWALEALLLASGGAQAERAALQGTFSNEQQNLEPITTAIETAVAKMNFIKRPIARSRLKKTNEAHRRVDIALGDTQISVAFDGHKPVQMPADGTTIKWTRDDGETFDVTFVRQAE